MKTIVVSDIHLTAKFDKSKFDFLRKLFGTSDKLIVNGDFWSCYSSTFDEFVQSEWRKLFPLMLKRNTTYIYGNHDRREFMDHRVKLFSVEQRSRLSYSLGKNKYHIEHGHLFYRHQSFTNGKLMELHRRLKVDERICRPLDHILHKTVGIRKFSPVVHLINGQMKRIGKGLFKNGVALFTGHTHLAEHDPLSKFVNTGFIDHGLAWYVEINNVGYKLMTATY